MKHINKILVMAVLLIGCFLCLATDPNNAVNSDYSSLEARITALEERLTTIENRLDNIGPRRPSAPAPAENDTGEFAKKRLTKQIEDANSAILRDENGLHKIGPRFVPVTPHKIRKSDVPEFMRTLDTTSPV